MIVKVLECVEKLQETYYCLLEEICNISSETHDFEGVRKVCDTICSFAEKRGFNICEREFPGAGKCAIISMNEDSGAPAFMFSGHMDTVYPKGTFPTPACRRDGSRLYGPGTADCKGGIVTALLAMDALKQSGYTARPLRLFLQCDEEVTSVCSNGKSIEWMVDEALKCAAFFNCEVGHSGTITVGRKGILKIIFAAHGRAAHAKDYFTGANAVVEASRKVIRLHALNQPGGITYNCTIASQPTASNVVPDLCKIAVDVRISTMEELRQAEKNILDIIGECETEGTRCEIIHRQVRPPMETNAHNLELLEKINRICEKHGLPVYKAAFSSGGSDAANVSAAGVPTLDSLGADGAGYHTTSEYCILPSITERAKVLAATAVDMDM